MYQVYLLKHCFLTKLDEMPAPGGAGYLGNGAVGHLVLLIVDQCHPGGPIREMLLVMVSYKETGGLGDHLYLGLETEPPDSVPHH